MTSARIVLLALFSAGLISAQANVEGMVVDRLTRAGIPGVQLNFNLRRGVRYQTVTDSGGGFRIPGMQEGEYFSSLTKDGYEPVRASSDGLVAAPTLKITAKDPPRLTFEMIAWTTLRARVVDPAGQPAANVPVEIRGPFAGGRNRGRAVTGTDGSIAFGQLLPGKFTLLAEPAPAKAKPVDGVRMEAVATYYPSALDRAQAQEITVLGNGEASGYEIRLRSAPVYRVRGVVLDESGKPAPRTRVYIGQPSYEGVLSSLGRTEFYLTHGLIDNDAEDERSPVLTGADGTFEFPSVPAGDWTVRAASEWEYEKDTHRDIQRVGKTLAFVSRHDMEDVEIRLASNFELSAAVEWPEEARTGGARWASVILWPAEGPADVFSGGELKPDNTIRFQAYPGHYTFVPMAAGVPGLYVSSILVGGREVLGQAFDLTFPPPPVRIIYKSGAGAVRANIDKGGSATVLLIPSDSPGGVPRSVTCDAATPCELTGLRPGDYSIAAFESVDRRKLMTPSYLPGLLAWTRRIRVAEGANVAVDLTANRWPD